MIEANRPLLTTLHASAPARPPEVPRNRVVERMAVAISCAFALPEAQRLAELLQVSAEQDVGTVLQMWICRCLLEIDETQAAQMLPSLVARLDEILAARRDS
ncbi:hypothetical protein AB4090_12510 [Acidithiobacillus sp. IBUN Pt1247-S3]|uniref:hypothetical protein n=1 Tax=Acidithiobacillus sp. IBUN Pt1247-S3 TaxID=3166642 RepID=UPI0034E3798F